MVGILILVRRVSLYWIAPMLSPVPSPKTAICHDANFVVTGGTVGCHNDNLRCRQWRQSWHHDNSRFPLVISLKTKHRQFDNFVAIGGTVSCHNDNLRCRQWWQSWHHENSHFPVVIMIYSPAPPQSGCARLLYQPSYGVYSYSASSSSPESEKKPRKYWSFFTAKETRWFNSLGPGDAAYKR